MAIAFNGSVLTLTGGSSGGRLTPNNIINDATAFSTGATYAVNAIVKYDAGGGLGTALYRCSTAVTVAGAWNPTNWAWMVEIKGRTCLIASQTLDIGAFYDDSQWQYDFVAGGCIRVANGANWNSGSFYQSSVYTDGFKCKYWTGGNVFNGGTTGNVVNWCNVDFVKKQGGNNAINFQNSVLSGSCVNLFVDGTLAGGDNSTLECNNVNITGFTYLSANFYINPTNKTGITHIGLYENGQENKIGVLSPSAANPLKKYKPAIPASNTKKVAIIGSSANQYYEDLDVPTGFDFSTQVVAYWSGMSAFFTRSVDIVCKNGATLLQGVLVRAVNTVDSTLSFSATSDANGLVSAKPIIFQGNRTASGAYTPLENAKLWQNKDFLFRRKDLVEATYSQNMATAPVVLTQFMASDAYYTADGSAYTGITVNAGAKTVTLSSAHTLDLVYDYLKYWLTQNMDVANMLAPSGKELELLSTWTVIGLEWLSAGTKLASINVSTAATASGAFTVSVTGNVTQATPTNLTGVAITGNLTYNQATDLTITLTDTTITGTVSNSGAGMVSISPAGSTSVGTAGTNVVVLTIPEYVNITGLVAGSRVQLYNVTTATILDNLEVAGTSHSYIITATSGDVIRLRVTKTGQIPFENFAVFAGASVSFVVNQLVDTIYNSYGIDGSTVTKFVADYGNSDIDLIVASNFSAKEFYAWYRYTATTEQGINNFFGGISAIDAGNIQLNNSIVDLYFDTTTSVNVFQDDNIRISRADGAYPVKNPTTGGGAIDLVWRNQVYIAETGVSGLTPSEATTLSKIDALTENVSGLRFTAKALETTPTGSGGATLAEIEASTVLAKEATVSTRASQASVTALGSPAQASALATLSGTLQTEHDATQAAIAAIPTNPLLANDTRLNNLDAAISSTLTAPQVRAELATELGRMDVAVSTRFASVDYTAPDNTSVAAIKAKTDTLVNAPTVSQIEASTVLAKEATAASRASQASVDALGSPAQASAVDALPTPLNSAQTQAAAAAALTAYDAVVPSDLAGLALESTAQSIKTKTDTLTNGPTLGQIEASTVIAKESTLGSISLSIQAEHDTTRAAIAALPAPLNSVQTQAAAAAALVAYDGVTPADLSLLATSANVTASQAAVIAAVEAVDVRAELGPELALIRNNLPLIPAAL